MNGESSEARPIPAPAGAVHSRDLRRSFVSGIAWSSAAKFSAQIVTWLSTFVVARLLSPADYGLVQMAVVYLGFVALFNEFGIGAAVVTLRDLSKRQIAVLNGFALAAGGASIAITLAVARPLGWFFDEPLLPGMLVVMGVGFVFTSARTVPQALLQRALRFKLLGSIEAGQAVLAALTTVTLAWLGKGYWALVLGSLTGVIAWAIAVLVVRRSPVAAPRLAPVRHALRFGSEVFIANLAWVLYASSHFLIVGKFLGADALGVYTFAWSIACMPVDKITAMLMGVMPAFFSALQHDRPALRSYFLYITEGLAFVTFPMTLGLGLVAHVFVPLVLGEQWQGAIAPLQVLSIFAAFQAVASSVPQILRVVGETRYFMLGNIVIALGLQVAFAVGIGFGEQGIAIAWVVAYPLLSLPLYWRAFQCIDVSVSDYLRALRPALSGSVLMTLAVLGVGRLFEGDAPSLLELAVCVGAGAATYAANALLFHRRRLVALRNLLLELRTPR